MEYKPRNIIIAVIVLALVAFVVWYFVLREQPNAATNGNTAPPTAEVETNKTGTLAGITDAAPPVMGEGGSLPVIIKPSGPSATMNSTELENGASEAPPAAAPIAAPYSDILTAPASVDLVSVGVVSQVPGVSPSPAVPVPPAPSQPGPITPLPAPARLPPNILVPTTPVPVPTPPPNVAPKTPIPAVITPNQQVIVQEGGEPVIVSAPPVAEQIITWMSLSQLIRNPVNSLKDSVNVHLSGTTRLFVVPWDWASLGSNGLFAGDYLHLEFNDGTYMNYKIIQGEVVFSVENKKPVPMLNLILDKVVKLDMLVSDPKKHSLLRASNSNLKQPIAINQYMPYSKVNQKYHSLGGKATPTVFKQSSNSAYVGVLPRDVFNRFETKGTYAMLSIGSAFDKKITPLLITNATGSTKNNAVVMTNGGFAILVSGGIPNGQTSTILLAVKLW